MTPTPTDQSSSFTFTLHWGGYYAYRTNDDTYTVWRLLDLNQHALHCVLYNATFDHMPTLDEAKVAQPLGMHTPLAPVAMLTKPELTYLGGAPLTPEALEGYAVYLEHQGTGAEAVEQALQNIVGYSQENPTQVRLHEDPEHSGSIIFDGKITQ